MTAPTLTVEVKWDAGAFEAGGTWSDITSLVKAITINRGRQHELGRDEAGVGVIELDNTDRRFDPAGYSEFTHGIGEVTVLRRCRIRATHNAITYELFQGVLENLEQGWAGRPIGHGGRGIARFELVDLFRSLTLLGMSNTYRTEVLADTPYGYWPADEGTGLILHDLGSGENDLITDSAVGGAPVWHADGPLIGGRPAITQETTPAFIAEDVGDDKDNFTLEAWVWHAGAGANDTQIAILSDGGVGYRWWWEVDGATDKPRLGIDTDGGGATAVTAAAAISTDAWHHLAAIRKFTKVRFYVDGALTDTFDVSSRDEGLSGPFNIQAVWGASSSRIAHLAWWRNDLSAERIAAHYSRKADTFAAAEAGTYIGRILDAVGWTAVGDRDLDTSTIVIADGLTGENGLEAALKAGEASDGGRVFVSGEGKITFRSRASIQAQITPEAVWVDGYRPEDVGGDGTGAELELHLDGAQDHYADGAQMVDGWRDRSPNGYDVTNATGSFRARWQTNELGGLPIVRFDATDDRFTSTDPANLDFGTGAYAIVVVAKVAGVSKLIVRKKASTAAGQSGWLLRTSASLGFIASISDGVTQVNTTAPTPAATPHGYHLIMVNVNRAANQSIYVDSLTAADQQDVTAVGSISNATDLTVGDATGLDADIAEIIVLSKLLTATERAALFTYLNDKWELGLAEPPTLPDLAYESADVRFDEADLWTEVDVAAAAGTHHVRSDTALAATIGKRALALETWLDHVNDAESMAEGVLARYNQATYRFESVTIDGASNDVRLAAMLSTELGDRVLARRQPPGPGHPIASHAFVSSIGWSILPPARWRLTLGLEPIGAPADPASDPYVGAPIQPWVLGDADSELGVTTYLGW